MEVCICDNTYTVDFLPESTAKLIVQCAQHECGGLRKPPNGIRVPFPARTLKGQRKEAGPSAPGFAPITENSPTYLILLRVDSKTLFRSRSIFGTGLSSPSFPERVLPWGGNYFVKGCGNAFFWSDISSMHLTLLDVVQPDRVPRQTGDAIIFRVSCSYAPAASRLPCSRPRWPPPVSWGRRPSWAPSSEARCSAAAALAAGGTWVPCMRPVGFCTMPHEMPYINSLSRCLFHP